MDATPDLPLAGITVVEFSSIAPAPFCSMILADFGADVVLVERPGGTQAGVAIEGAPLLSRGKRSIILDLGVDDDLGVALELADRADVLIEGYRPGVMEKLGLGPDVLCKRNPGLVYTRVSGWGQDGPWARRAGHDINYIALAGPLGQVGWDGPVPPGAFVGDFAGGTLTAVIGVLMALQARQRDGRGQVVDAAILDGAAQLMAPLLELRQHGWVRDRGDNLVDGLAPFYGSYQCADGAWYSVGAIEPKFYANLLQALDITDETLEDQQDTSRWPALRRRVQEVFRTRTRDEWDEVFGELDVCAAPVLDFDELPAHPHLAARGLFVADDDGIHTRPSPRLSRTPGRAGRPLTEPGAHSDEIRAELRATSAPPAGP